MPGAPGESLLWSGFDQPLVLDGIDLNIPQGSIFALLGPNGAGKTTAVQILSTLIAADGGKVRVAGHDLAREPYAVRAAIGVTGQFSAVDGLPTQVGIVLVVLATVIAFAVGMGLFALAARRSDRWARTVLVAGVLFAVGSAGGPLSTAEDTSTGVLLAAMHLLTGAAFAITASRARR